MKKTFYLLIMFAMVFQLGIGPLPSSAAQENPQAHLASSDAQSGEDIGEMPGWPEPVKPVPHHKPGQVSKASSYTADVTRLNAQGGEETVQLSGMDAMVADGQDPFAGNYTMVSYDQLLLGSSSSVNNLLLMTEKVSEPTPGTRTFSIMDGSAQNLGNYPFFDIAAGDLNKDGDIEQLVAWRGDLGRVYLSAGETPGIQGKTTSAPAAVARGGTQVDGSALQINGINDFMNAGPGINLANQSFTVAFWARRSTINTYDYVVGQGIAATNMGLHVGFRNSNVFTCGFYSNDLDTTVAYTDTAWHHWACTYDATTKLKTIYRDGVQVARVTAPANYQGSGSLYIGTAFNSNFSFGGLIDEVGIWNTARSQDRIQADLMRLNPDETSLLAYWRLDGTTADASGGGHTGTLSGSPTWNPENAPLGEVHLLVRGYDQALWQCAYDLDNQRCLGWNNSAGGSLLSAPAVASLGEGQFDVFAIGTDNQVWRRHWQGGWQGGWTLYAGGSMWAPVPFWNGPAPELPPLAVAARNGKFDLFRLGTDNSLYWHDGSAWHSLGGMLASPPGVLSLSGSHMQVFAAGFNGDLYHITFNGGWGAWGRLHMAGMPAGVTIASAPVAVSPSAGTIVVYVRGSDNQAWSIQKDGGGWGSWNAAGGLLASVPGAVVTPGGAYLFAQTTDSLLQISRARPNWENLGGLPPQSAVYDTGFIAYNKTVADFQDFTLSLKTGYFFGDGRSQVALAYFYDATHIKIAVYEYGERFLPAKNQQGQVKVITLEIKDQAADYFRMVTGDFLDGDGNDEIAIAYLTGNTYNLSIYDVSRDAITRKATTAGTTAQETLDKHFVGTLGLTAGDFDGDGQDEVAMVTVRADSTWLYLTTCDAWSYNMNMRAYDILQNQDTKNFRIEKFNLGFWGATALKKDYSAQVVGLAITAGDLDGDGKDELVRTWPTRFSTYADSCGWSDEPVTSRFVRRLEVVSLGNNSNKFTNTWGAVPNLKIIPVTEKWWTPSYQDSLAVGDLNRDISNEIIWQKSDELSSYYLDRDAPASTPYKAFTTNLPIGGLKYPRIVTGAFSGESVRVGPPSYRVQNRVDTLVAIINTPPVHRDIIKDANGSSILMKTPLETCLDSSIDPQCTHARYGSSKLQESATTIETKHAYTVTAGLENKACLSQGVKGVAEVSACVKTSVEYTHGGTFNNTKDNINSTEFKHILVAAGDDKIIYYGTPYAVWEYPILPGPDEPGEEQEYITVVSPLITNTKYPSSMDGHYSGTCDKNFYAAGHQPGNVWSYDNTADPINFLDFSSAGLIFDVQRDGYALDDITYTNFQSTMSSSTYTHSIKAGLEVEAKGKVDVKIYSAEANFKMNIKGSYDYSKMKTDTFTTKQGTSFSYFLSSKSKESSYITRPILYWSKAGHIVLDYQARPGEGAFWQKYNKPDPAFTLPWYGFPDPNKPEDPSCGAEMKLFSHDVLADPQIVSAGEQVNLSATVRSFSNIGAQNVSVRFCLGDPGPACKPGGSAYIGEYNIPSLSRSSGSKTASVTWTASGVGKQNIYAVIDPENRFDEMHDDDDLINNNIAYGQVEVGAAAYFDMGQVVEKTYQSQSYEQDQSLTVSVFMPLGNLSAVTRLDLKDSDRSVDGIGNPFILLAYQGEEDWGTPAGMNFYLTNITKKQAPAVLTITYSDNDIAGRDEGSLKLYRFNGSAWEDASRTCGIGGSGEPVYKAQRFAEDNEIAVPVCQTGTFILSDREVIEIDSGFHTYLPVLGR